MKEVIFLGSKEIGIYCLKQLWKHPAVKITGVLSNNRKLETEGITVSGFAREKNLPVYASPDDMPRADILISVQYHEILKKHHLEKARELAVNLHLAPLPEYRGCNQFSFALMDEKTEFGTTLHMMDEGIDSGDILFERRFPIPQRCNVKQLYNLTLEASKTLFKEHLDDLLNSRYTPISQESLAARRGTSIHYRNEIEDLKKIDIGMSENEIDKRIRATYFPPFAPPYTIIEGKTVHLNFDWKNILKKEGVPPYGHE